MSQSNGPNRLAAFKNKGKDPEEMRRRRSTVSVELRKASRDRNMLKRRNISDVWEGVPDAEQSRTEGLKLKDIIAGLKSSEEEVLFNAIQGARKILSSQKNPPIQKMIQAGIVPHCVELLSDTYGPKFQFEACWALTNIASGNSRETRVVVSAGAIPRLIGLLKSPHIKVAEQAVWALGNIAGDGPELRDTVIAAGVIPPLLELAQSKVSVPTLRNIAWSISSLCRNKNPPPPFEAVSMFLPMLRKLLTHGDEEVLTDTCWALSYLTDGPDNNIQTVIDAGVVPDLVGLLSSQRTVLLSPAVRAVGNIVTGNREQTDAVINAGALERFRDLLSHPKSSIVKEAAWSVSNITAGTSAQIEAVVQAGILPALIKVLDSHDFKSQKEAAWAVTNFTSGANIRQLMQLLAHGVIPPFCNLLTAKDSKVVSIILDGLSNILTNADDIGELNRVAILIEECGGVDKLEALIHHELNEIYQKALKIIETFFQDETTDVNLGADEVTGQYVFKGGDPTGKFSF